MNTTWIGLAIATVAVTGIVLALGVGSLVIGSIEFLFGRPKLTFLKSQKGENGFAFHFKWNAAKEPAKFNGIRIKLFNAFGKPSQMELSREFDPATFSFARDIDFGPGMYILKNARGLQDALVQIELYASEDGLNQGYEMRGSDFMAKLVTASKSVTDFGKQEQVEKEDKDYGIRPREMIADTVPGRGPKLKLPTNPEFLGSFQTSANPGVDGAAAAVAVAANFSVTKVWIDPGCIVCNACEDIFADVFKVNSDTCIIRPGAPLDNGLKIQEAAEACPVEVIKFQRA